MENLHPFDILLPKELIENLALGKSSGYLNTFRIKSTRLSDYDYSRNGLYFVTIETFRMQNYLGNIVQTSHGTSLQKAERENEETCLSTSMQLSDIGIIAEKNWTSIPQHFPFVELDSFQIMPNHLHGIIKINNTEIRKKRLNEFKSLPGTLGTIINLYKGSVTKFANENNIEFKWHPRYHEIIIRDLKSLENIRNYIHNNPQKWLDKYGNK